MDDMAAQINQILGSPEGMQQLQSIAAALGLSPPSAQPAPSAPSVPVTPQPFSGIPGQQNGAAQNSSGNFDPSAIAAMLSSLMNSSQAAPQAPPPAPAIDPGMLMTLQRAVQAVSAGNKNVDLLRALRPHFSEARQKKVDDAIRLLQLLNLLPVLKESGFFRFADKEENGTGEGGSGS